MAITSNFYYKPDFKSLMALTCDYSLEQVIDIPTRYGTTGSSIIDLIFTDSKNIAQHSTINVN